MEENVSVRLNILVKDIEQSYLQLRYVAFVLQSRYVLFVEDFSKHSYKLPFLELPFWQSSCAAYFHFTMKTIDKLSRR